MDRNYRCIQTYIPDNFSEPNITSCPTGCLHQQATKSEYLGPNTIFIHYNNNIIVYVGRRVVGFNEGVHKVKQKNVATVTIFLWNILSIWCEPL